MKIIINGYGKIGKLLNKVLNDEQVLLIDPLYFNNRLFEVKEDYDVIIDFSHKKAIYEIKDYLDNHPKTKLIIGTTSYEIKENEIVNKLKNEHVIIKDSNYSYSMFLFKKMIATLNKYDLNDFKIDLKETHNVTKKDAPSGTSLDLVKLFDKEIDIHSIRNKTRKGGKHELVLKDKYGIVRLVHQANDRMMFVEGIMKVLKLIYLLPNGLYSFEEVLDYENR